MAKSIFALSRSLTPEEVQARRSSLVRLGLAWLAMMQVMMFALPGYLRRDSYGHDNLEVLDSAIELMNWVSLAMTVPVLLYSAWPVWRGTWRALRRWHATMDVPVAISMVAAFVPSLYATLSGHGEVYYDSVTMFVAFLLTARFFEERARMSIDNQRFASEMETLRAPLMARADRVAMWFIAVQLSIAAVVAIYWWQVEPGLALPIMVSLLVMSCPCALALAAPATLAAANATLAACPHLNHAQMQTLVLLSQRITRQNLYGALVFHLITTPLAAVGLVTPWLAALAMFVSSAAVVANAWRLYRIPPDSAAESSHAMAG